MYLASEISTERERLKTVMTVFSALLAGFAVLAFAFPAFYSSECADLIQGSTCTRTNTSLVGLTLPNGMTPAVSLACALVAALASAMIVRHFNKATATRSSGNNVARG